MGKYLFWILALAYILPARLGGQTAQYKAKHLWATQKLTVGVQQVTSLVASVNGVTGDVVITKATVGLSNADNTSDANKPISTATQTALDGKQPLDADLTAIAALAPADGKIIKRVGGVWAAADDATSGGGGSDNTAFAVSAGNLGITDGAGTLNVPVSDIAPVQAVAAGTGISISGTTTRTITNSAPDQTVALTAGTGIGTSGTYPNFTIANTGDTDASNDLTTASTAGGDLSGTFSNLQIVADAVGGSEIADNAVGNLEMADNAIGNAELADNAVGNLEMADNAIGNAEIADNAVNTAELAANAVTSAKMSNLVTAGSCTNCNVTFDAAGRATTYSNGSGGGGGGAVLDIKRQAADQTNTGGITLANSTDISFSATSGKKYQLSGMVGTSTSAATGGGLKLHINAASSNFSQYAIILRSGTSSVPVSSTDTSTPISLATIGSTGAIWSFVYASFTATATGSVALQFGSNSSGNITLLAGSQISILEY